MLKKITSIFISFTAVVSISGCQYEQLNRNEFMSNSAGNAIAHNSALQIIDPWPRSAGDNKLKVPTGEYGGEPKEGAAPPTPIVIQTSGGEQ